MGAMLRKPLSEEAKELLLEAVQDKEGYVIRRRYFGGLEIKTNNRTFGEQGNPKDQATWEAALNELFYGNLAQIMNAEVYRVKKAGYDMAEKLTKPDD